MSPTIYSCGGLGPRYDATIQIIKLIACLRDHFWKQSMLERHPSTNFWLRVLANRVSRYTSGREFWVQPAMILCSVSLIRPHDIQRLAGASVTSKIVFQAGGKEIRARSGAEEGTEDAGPVMKACR